VENNTYSPCKVRKTKSGYPDNKASMSVLRDIQFATISAYPPEKRETFMHRSHVSLVKWFQTLYFITQHKHGISATQLSFSIGVNYKTAWFMLKGIRAAMGQRDSLHLLSGDVEFDDAPLLAKKRGRGTEKAKAFVALQLDKNGNPKSLKMDVAENIQQKRARDFANEDIESGTTILSEGYRSYIQVLTDYDH
jgi:hypothetical protein